MSGASGAAYQAVLSTGANLGDPASQLARVVDAFDGGVCAASSVWLTPPWGVTDQPEFRNQIVVVRTSRSPEELLRYCQGLEHAAHRVRDRRWGPRTLDVDVVQIRNAEGQEVLSDDPLLTLPHPRAHLRAFVLVPWREVEPEARLRGRTLTELIKTLNPSEVAAMRRLPTLGSEVPPRREDER